MGGGSSRRNLQGLDDLLPPRPSNLSHISGYPQIEIRLKSMSGNSVFGAVSEWHRGASETTGGSSDPFRSSQTTPKNRLDCPVRARRQHGAGGRGRRWGGECAFECRCLDRRGDFLGHVRRRASGVRQANSGVDSRCKSGGKEGVTSHFCREPCVGSREGMGEASVAVRVGRANERRNS